MVPVKITIREAAVRYRLREKELTARKAAEELGVSEGHFSKLLSGSARMGWQHFIKLALLLDQDPDVWADFESVEQAA